MRTIITIVAVALQVICLASGGWARPFTRIVSPAPNQVVPGPDVKVQFVAGGATLGTGGWNLHFKLDDEPFQVKYNANRAHVFKNVMPGSHTVRMYMADAQHQAIPGTLSTVSFSVAHYDGANIVRPGQPLLTWNLPQGEYLGVDALDVTLDFMVENVALSPGGYQVAYYVDGRRFLVQDGNHRRHIKDLAPGLHRVRIELQDCYGDIVPGTFNSGERVIAISPYDTKGSAPAATDGYVRSPRIESIPGSMTAGGPRPVMRPPASLTPEQREKKLGLTVDRDGGVVRLDGQEPGAATAGTASSGSVDVYVPGAPEAREHQEEPMREELEGQEEVNAVEPEFQVRQGGEPDIAPQDLEEPPPANLKSGSVVVNPEADDEDDAVVEITETEEHQTTRSSTRKRADGSTSKVERTTETLRLADRPGMRDSDKETTRTVRVQDSKTTKSKSKSKSDDDKSTGSKSKADDSNSTGSDERRAETARRRERRDRATRRGARDDSRRDRKTTESKKSDGEPPSPDLD